MLPFSHIQLLKESQMTCWASMIADVFHLKFWVLNEPQHTIMSKSHHKFLEAAPDPGSKLRDAVDLTATVPSYHQVRRKKLNKRGWG